MRKHVDEYKARLQNAENEVREYGRIQRSIYDEFGGTPEKAERIRALQQADAELHNREVKRFISFGALTCNGECFMMQISQ